MRRPLTKIRRRESLGEDVETTSIPKKRLRLPNKELELGRKVEDTFALGKVPGIKSLRLKYKRESLVLGCVSSVTRAVKGKCTLLKPDELAKWALRDYYKKHGVDLVFVKLMHFAKFRGPGYFLDFSHLYSIWMHLNFTARRRNSSDELCLFAEVYEMNRDYYLTTLSLVQPTVGGVDGCQRCCPYMSHPRHGFRAGFDPPVASDAQRLTGDAVATLAKFALQDYNKKHGSNLMFERALTCNSFTCAGLLMDFNTKITSWVHMNFEAMGPKRALYLFAELYLGHDGKYVLATLSLAEPPDEFGGGRWKTDPDIERVCPCCPDHICHPWRGYRFAFNCPPIRKPLAINAKEHGIECPDIYP